MKYTAIIILLFLAACNKEKQHTESVPLEVAELAESLGNDIASKAQQNLGSNLMKQVNQNGTEEAVRFCNLAANLILDTLNVGLNVKIKRAAIKARNPNDLPTESEKAIILRYEKALSENEPLDPVVEILNKSEVLFAAPIQTKNDMCLKCHGSIQTDIDEATLTRIRSLYPDDNATGHKVGDLRGIWSITFDIKELLNYTPKGNVSMDGLQLLKQNCYSCHNPNAESHELAIAPPMAGVKRRYLTIYQNEKSFKSKMISFLKEPSKERAIMKGPVRRFGVMPKFQWSDAQIKEMVDYIYQSELEQPEWFDKHYEEMHSKSNN